MSRWCSNQLSYAPTSLLTEGAKNSTKREESQAELSAEFYLITIIFNREKELENNRQTVDTAIRAAIVKYGIDIFSKNRI